MLHIVVLQLKKLYFAITLIKLKKSCSSKIFVQFSAHWAFLDLGQVVVVPFPLQSMLNKLMIRDRKNMWKNIKYFFTYFANFCRNEIFCQKSHIFQIFSNIFQYFFNILVFFQYFGIFSNILYFFHVMQLQMIKSIFENFN